jgi:zinc protease
MKGGLYDAVQLTHDMRENFDIFCSVVVYPVIPKGQIELRIIPTAAHTDEDIDKFKGSIESQYINGLQSISGKVSQLAAFQTFTGNPNQIGNMLSLYQSVTKESVMNAYNKYIKNKGCVTVSVLTKSDKNAPALVDNYKVDTTNYTQPNYGYNGLKYVKGKDKFDRSVMPGTTSNPTIIVPAYWKKDLPNGIKVIGAVYNELPLVNIAFTIPGGHLADKYGGKKVLIAALALEVVAVVLAARLMWARALVALAVLIVLAVALCVVWVVAAATNSL